MADEKTQTTENTEAAGQENTEREYSSIEIKAIEQGWIPKEDFDGDDSEFIDAPEFVRRGELFTKIEKQSKELKAVRQAFEALRTHYTKVKEVEYDRAMKTLKEAKRQATVDGDHERALVLDEKIEEIRSEKDVVQREAAQTAVREPEEYNPKFREWVSRNDWYESNKLMRKTADALGKDLYEEGYAPDEVLDLVEKEIRKEFSHKFQNPAAKRAPAVEGTTRGSPSKKDSFSMSPEEEKIMRKIVSTGAMTEAQYKADLKAIRDK